MGVKISEEAKREYDKIITGKILDRRSRLYSHIMIVLSVMKNLERLF